MSEKCRIVGHVWGCRFRLSNSSERVPLFCTRVDGGYCCWLYSTGGPFGFCAVSHNAINAFYGLLLSSVAMRTIRFSLCPRSKLRQLKTPRINLGAKYKDNPAHRYFGGGEPPAVQGANKMNRFSLRRFFWLIFAVSLPVWPNTLIAFL